MREILFKAKRIDNGEWVEGALFDGEKYCVIGQEIKFNPNIENECKIVGFTVDRNTICQYTGLTDKNGNKIWENDVIQYIDEDLAVNGVVRFGRHEQIVMLELGFYVEWVSNEAECFKTDICYWVEKRDIDVIGNVYDNRDFERRE